MSRKREVSSNNTDKTLSWPPHHLILMGRMEAVWDNCVCVCQVCVCIWDVFVCVCQISVCLLELFVCCLQLSFLLFHWIPHIGLAVLIWQCTHRKIQFDANHVYGTRSVCVCVHVCVKIKKAVHLLSLYIVVDVCSQL